MESRIERQLKKGALELIVLRLLEGRPSYGYELLAELARRSGGYFTLREGTLYPILYRLEDDGLLASAWGEGAGRSVTEKGRQALAEGLALWRVFSGHVTGLLTQEDAI